jgi:hypothetical protein
MRHVREAMPAGGVVVVRHASASEKGGVTQLAHSFIDLSMHQCREVSEVLQWHPLKTNTDPNAGWTPWSGF